VSTSSNEYSDRNFKVDLYAPRNDETTVYCSCGCGKGLHADFKFAQSDGDVFIETIVPGFYAHQFGIWNRIKRRLYAAWRMLIGKEFLMHEIMLDHDHWSKFVASINEMHMIHCNHIAKCAKGESEL